MDEIGELYLHPYASNRGGSRGGPGGPVPPFKKFFYIYVTIAINIMKILFNDV